MADPLVVFGAMAALIFLGLAGNVIFARLRFNDTILLIGLGTLVGPGLHLIEPAAVAPVRAIVGPLALILILFDGGLALKLRDLVGGLGGAAALAVLGFVLSAVGVAALAAPALGIPFMTALLLGSILGGTSAMVVLPSLQHMRVSRRTSTILGLESTMTSVLVVVGTFALINIVALGQGPDAQSVASKLLITFSMSIFSGAAMGFLWLYVAPQLKDRPYGYMVTLGVVLALYVAVEWLLQDVSNGGGPLAVLAFGIVLGNGAALGRSRAGADFAPGLKRFQGELAFLVRTFFFVYLGILVDLSLLEDLVTWGLGGLILVAFIVTRCLAVMPVERTLRLAGEPLIMALMVPRGLAAAVMAAEPARQGIPGTERFVALGFLAIILSNVFTTVASLVLERRMPSQRAGPS